MELPKRSNLSGNEKTDFDGFNRLSKQLRRDLAWRLYFYYKEKEEETTDLRVTAGYLLKRSQIMKAYLE